MAENQASLMANIWKVKVLMSERWELGGIFVELLLIIINWPLVNNPLEFSCSGQKVRELGREDDRIFKFLKFI